MPGIIKERPILFNGEMVRAILESRKTQTRRLVKPQPIPGKISRQRLGNCGLPIHDSDFEWIEGPGQSTFSSKKNGPTDWVKSNSPYGQPGERLWVRETWNPLFSWDRDSGYNHSTQVIYEASPEESEKKYGDIKNGRGQRLIDNIKRWKPSVHMPRWASRITLEITNVRLERLQNISEEDAAAEGIQKYYSRERQPGGCVIETQSCNVENFARLWDTINGPGAWDKNPWVWVIEFKRVVL